MAKSRKSRSRSRRSKKAPMRSFTVEAAKDSNGKNIMVSWFEELIGNAGYTENVKKTVKLNK